MVIDNSNRNDYDKGNDFVEDSDTLDTQELDKFIKYTKFFVKNNIKAILYLKRRSNVIQYGSFDINDENAEHKLGMRGDGKINDQYFIQMRENTDLKLLYESLKIEFYAEFTAKNEKMPIHSFNDRTFCPYLSENVIIILRSDDKFDHEWFRAEKMKYHKKEEDIIDVEEIKKK